MIPLFNTLSIKSFFKEQTSSGNYFAPLTGLRGLAATLVLLFHISSLVPIQNDEAGFMFKYFFRWIYGFGFLGVPIFFVLSGFLLSFSFLSAYKKKQKPDLKKFAINRCLRVLPSYYVQLIIFIVGGWLLFDSKYTVYNIIMHFLMLHNFDITINSLINGVYWTLPIEWNFYFIMPILSIFFLRNRWFWLVIIALAIGISSRIIIGEVVFADVDTNKRIWILSQVFSIPEYFLFGMVGAYWRFNLNDDSWAIRYGDFIMIAGALMLCIGISVVDWSRYWIGQQHYWWNSFAPIALTLFIFGASAQKIISKVLWTNRIMMILGVLSYGIYLWHLTIIHLINGNLLPQLKLSDWLMTYGFSPVMILLIVTVVVLGLTSIISYINHQLIEKPFLQLKSINKR